MMIVLGITSLIIAVFLLGLQIIWAFRFALVFPPKKSPRNDEQSPFAAIVLCIRGADQSLSSCLRNLLNQDYPSYEIHLVLDRVGDPGMEVVKGVLGEDPPKRVFVHVLENPLETCSLKVSALMQILRSLDEAIKVVALIDADVEPYRHWLRDLVGPFADPKVGATNGLRWYVATEKANLWTRIRALWNAGACSQMVALDIPWGGSMALHSRLFRNPALFAKWSRNFGEDTCCNQVLKEIGLRLECVTAVTMVNREPTDGKKAFSFIRRQLISARIGHEKWPVVLVTGLATVSALAGMIIALVIAIAAGAWEWAALSAGIIGLYFTGLGLNLAWTHYHINRLVQARGEPTFSFAWQFALAVPCTLFVYFACLLSAALARRVEWRGITYSLEGKGRIRMTGYRPFGDPPENEASQSVSTPANHDCPVPKGCHLAEASPGPRNSPRSANTVSQS
jgi:cellulose synthase/poly-beta-1,6-N-acetylglucosamine synthase-like glycosyltransferase